MHEDLKPGVDRPRRGQYVLVVLIIALLAIAGYLYRRSGEPQRGPGMDLSQGVPGTFDESSAARWTV